MPDGLLLYGAGLICAAAFVADVVREDRAAGGISTPGWHGWLLAGLAVACMVGGTALLARSVFSG